MKEFGSYGSGEGEFDCLAGVAVNRIGQYIIADRYNHRIQVLDPSGRFLRAFGSQGTADGRFNYPWGITTDALGFIYVCDKENHRVQVRGLALLILIFLFIIIRFYYNLTSEEGYGGVVQVYARRYTTRPLKESLENRLDFSRFFYIVL